MTSPRSNRRRRFRETLIGLAWTSPWLVGSALFVFLPMAMSLYYSFTDFPLIEPPIWTGTSNYARMGDDPTFLRVVHNTAIYAAFSIPLCTILGVSLAALLQGRVRFARFFRACIFIPTLVPLVAVAMVWMWLFNGEFGFINQALSRIGIKGPAWIVDASWVMPSMIIMSLWSVGQSVVIYTAAMQDVPRHLYEAARLDGMTAFQRFRHVTVPMISPAILFNVIVMTINAVQVFAVPYVMFRRPDGQNPAGHFYTMYLYENAFVYGQMGYACAMAWLQLLIILALTGAMFLASRKLVYYRGA
ncbi:Lactose transport system permease protein LacF [Phycisphaerales bacterium]|nr:Lactose transport system permease protein LacF [Phycisphaerales bacterium]